MFGVELSMKVGQRVLLSGGTSAELRHLLLELLVALLELLATVNDYAWYIGRCCVLLVHVFHNRGDVLADALIRRLCRSEE